MLRQLLNSSSHYSLRADGYLGLAVIYGAMSLFWFVGIQGPSIVEPAVSAIYYVTSQIT